MDESRQASIDRVLTQYGLRSSGAVELVGGGTLNWNHRAAVSSGAVFVRLHRQDVTVARVREEHALIAFAAAGGIPVARPLRTTSGETVVELDGGIWAIFPWVDGVRPDRSTLSASQVRAAGEMHGRVQAVLANYAFDRGTPFPTAWDRESSARSLDSVIAAARARRVDEWILEALLLQRDLLRRERMMTSAEFEPHMPVQICHGDFHDQQLLFDASGAVNLVCDWEMFGVRPRAWEVVRSIAFALILNEPLQQNYLEGYRQHFQISETEARAAVRLWLQSRVVTPWVWSAHFLEGNERVAEFFPRAAHDLKNLATPGWREAVERRFVADAMGW